MAPSEDNIAPGTIADISQRLTLWARRDLPGIVRVEYSSEFARRQVMANLSTQLASADKPITEITLPTFQAAEEVVHVLIDQLEKIAAEQPGIVSVTGFATAFNNQQPLEDALRVVNFNRDHYVALPLQQIWWLPPSLMSTAIHAMPDLNSFFLQKLQLTEVVLAEVPEAKLAQPEGSTANIDDARHRAYGLIRQYEAAKTSDAPPEELLTTYILPALEALAEVGAQKELRDLTQQFEGILSQLKLIDSLDLSNSLDRLATLYKDQGRYSEADPLYQKALALRQKLLGGEQPLVATSLNNLAGLYIAQGRYSEAESLYQQALALRQKLLGKEHPDVAESLNNLASLYADQGRYSKAEPIYQQALALRQKLSVEEHPDVATSLNNLALLYADQGRYSEAEPLHQQALALRQKLVGEEHSDVATSLNNLASLYQSQGRYSEAEPLYQQALALWEKLLGKEHPLVATSLNNLAGLYTAQGRYSEAEPLHQQALALRQKLLGEEHPGVATSLNNLALLYAEQGRYSKAELLYQKALAIWQKLLEEEHPDTQTILRNFSGLIQQVVAAGQAELLSEHPLTQTLLQQVQADALAEDQDTD